MASFRSGSERRIKEGGVDVLMGEGSLTGPKSVAVKMNDGGIRNLTADMIFVNTGRRPAKPSIPGIEDVTVLNSRSIMELDAVPSHLLIIGGGYIGLEFGQMFRRFGSQVTVIQRGSRLLAREDGNVADEVAKILREDGLEILLDTSPVKVAKGRDGSIALTVMTTDGQRILTSSHLLAAAGRVPNSDKLNLAAAGVEMDQHGYIKTNDKLETNVDGIYALGDVKGGPALTHISYDYFRIVRTNLIEGGSASKTVTECHSCSVLSHTRPVLTAATHSASPTSLILPTTRHAPIHRPPIAAPVLSRLGTL